jgi:uncharacterized protein YhaN
MRLERLTLAPYGRFADCTLSFRPDASLHVVLGANEAGKTTALSAIGDLLYGFPLQTDYGFRFEMSALRVGGALRFADGSLFEFRRRKGRSATVVDADDRAISDAPLLAALGSVDRRTFETEFGLTSQALRDGARALLAAGGRLAETLAAGSAGLSALVKLRETLSVDADALFTPRKSAGKAFYVALDAYDAAEKKLRDATVTADALKAADQKRAEALNDEQRLREEYGEAGRVLAKRERASRTHATLARLDALAGELQTFSDLPEIDASSLDAASQSLADDRALQTVLARLAAEAEAESAEIAKLVVDADIVAAGAEIDALREKLGAARKAAHDLPHRLEARAQALAQLDDVARRLGLVNHQAVLASPPSDPEFARARQAIELRREATRRLDEARARARDAAANRDQLAADVEDETLVDPEPLRRRLEPLGERLADEDRLRRERSGIEAQTRAIGEEAARLDPAVADLDALARAALPSPADLAAAAEADHERAKARQAADKELDRAARDVAAAEAALANREREATGATRADWLAARERRERTLDRLGATLDGEAAPRRDAFDLGRTLTLAADAIGDAVVADSERAVRLEAARDELASRRDALSRAEAEARRRAAEREAAEAEWRALWARSEVEPRPPAAMTRWADRVDALLKRRAELGTRRAEVEVLTRRLEAAEDGLRQWFSALGLVAPPGFEFAYREARDEINARQAAWDAARKAADARATAARTAQGAGVEAARRQTDLAELMLAWPEAMRGLRLSDAATLAEAEAALTAWGDVALPRQSMMRESRSIEGIERDLAEFERSVRDLARRLGPQLVDRSAEADLLQLCDRLTEARRIAAERARLEQSAERRAGVRRTEEARRQALAPSIDAARSRLGAEDETGLALALERAEARRARREDRADSLRQLGEAGDGLSEAELRAEQQTLDLALLGDEIERWKSRRADLLLTLSDAARKVRDAEAEYDALAAGRDAAGAARERMEARGELLDVAERWILRQGAARLAARAIERHRAVAQDPLIARAGALFKVATDGSFCGLGADYDDADRPLLVALSENGERVRIDAQKERERGKRLLSEGARDQLFLSLRLALLERRAGEPLPFIGDDILASFDDRRTELTLKLLAEFGNARQAIVFTHHRHVADLARAVGAEVTEL